MPRIRNTIDHLLHEIEGNVGYEKPLETLEFGGGG
jgi:hypothetical protein